MFYGVIRISFLFRKSRNITIYLGSEERESYLIRDILLEYLKSLNLSLHTKWLTTKSKTPRRIRFTICKWSKHGDTCLSTPERSHVVDLTVCMDVHPNPGWDSTLSLARSFHFPAIRNLNANEATAFNRSSYLNADLRGYGSSTFNCLSLTTPRYFHSFNVEHQVRKYRRSRQAENE